MECCNSYAIDGHEPNGKTTLVGRLGLELHTCMTFLVSSLLCKTLQRCQSLAFLNNKSVEEERGWI